MTCVWAFFERTVQSTVKAPSTVFNAPLLVLKKAIVHPLRSMHRSLFLAVYAQSRSLSVTGLSYIFYSVSDVYSILLLFQAFSPFVPLLCLKPLMLSVVNGLASCFKAAIAECTF